MIDSDLVDVVKSILSSSKKEIPTSHTAKHMNDIILNQYFQLNVSSDKHNLLNGIIQLSEESIAKNKTTKNWEIKLCTDILAGKKYRDHPPVKDNPFLDNIAQCITGHFSNRVIKYQIPAMKTSEELLKLVYLDKFYSKIELMPKEKMTKLFLSDPSEIKNSKQAYDLIIGYYNKFDGVISKIEKIKIKQNELKELSNTQEKEKCISLAMQVVSLIEKSKLYDLNFDSLSEMHENISDFIYRFDRKTKERLSKYQDIEDNLKQFDEAIKRIKPEIDIEQSITQYNRIENLIEKIIIPSYDDFSEIKERKQELHSLQNSIKLKIKNKKPQIEKKLCGILNSYEKIILENDYDTLKLTSKLENNIDELKKLEKRYNRINIKIPSEFNTIQKIAENKIQEYYKKGERIKIIIQSLDALIQGIPKQSKLDEKTAQKIKLIEVLYEMERVDLENIKVDDFFKKIHTEALGKSNDCFKKISCFSDIFHDDFYKKLQNLNKRLNKIDLNNFYTYQQLIGIEEEIKGLNNISSILSYSLDASKITNRTRQKIESYNAFIDDIFIDSKKIIRDCEQTGKDITGIKEYNYLNLKKIFDSILNLPDEIGHIENQIDNPKINTIFEDILKKNYKNLEKYTNVLNDFYQKQVKDFDNIKSNIVDFNLEIDKNDILSIEDSIDNYTKTNIMYKSIGIEIPSCQILSDDFSSKIKDIEKHFTFELTEIKKHLDETKINTLDKVMNIRKNKSYVQLISNFYSITNRKTPTEIIDISKKLIHRDNAYKRLFLKRLNSINVQENECYTVLEQISKFDCSDYNNLKNINKGMLNVIKKTNTLLNKYKKDRGLNKKINDLTNIVVSTKNCLIENIKTSVEDIKDELKSIDKSLNNTKYTKGLLHTKESIEEITSKLENLRKNKFIDNNETSFYLVDNIIDKYEDIYSSNKFMINKSLGEILESIPDEITNIIEYNNAELKIKILYELKETIVFYNTDFNLNNAITIIKDKSKEYISTQKEAQNKIYDIHNFMNDIKLNLFSKNNLNKSLIVAKKKIKELELQINSFIKIPDPYFEKQTKDLFLRYNKITSTYDSIISDINQKIISNFTDINNDISNILKEKDWHKFLILEEKSQKWDKGSKLLYHANLIEDAKIKEFIKNNYLLHDIFLTTKSIAKKEFEDYINCAKSIKGKVNTLQEYKLQFINQKVLSKISKFTNYFNLSPEKITKIIRDVKKGLNDYLIIRENKTDKIDKITSKFKDTDKLINNYNSYSDKKNIDEIVLFLKDIDSSYNSVIGEGKDDGLLYSINMLQKTKKEFMRKLNPISLKQKKKIKNRVQDCNSQEFKGDYSKTIDFAKNKNIVLKHLLNQANLIHTIFGSNDLISYIQGKRDYNSDIIEENKQKFNNAKSKITMASLSLNIINSNLDIMDFKEKKNYDEKKANNIKKTFNFQEKVFEYITELGNFSLDSNLKKDDFFEKIEILGNRINKKIYTYNNNIEKEVMNLQINEIKIKTDSLRYNNIKQYLKTNIEYIDRKSVIKEAKKAITKIERYSTIYKKEIKKTEKSLDNLFLFAGSIKEKKYTHLDLKELKKDIIEYHNSKKALDNNEYFIEENICNQRYKNINNSLEQLNCDFIKQIEKIINHYKYNNEEIVSSSSSIKRNASHFNLITHKLACNWIKQEFNITKIKGLKKLYKYL